MTQPVVPTPPAAPATPPAAPPVAPAAPVVTPPVAPAAPVAPAVPAEDVTSLPDWAQKAIKDARADAAKARTDGKKTAAQEAREAMAQEIGKAIGLVPNGTPVDPAELTKQLEAARGTQRQALVDLAIYQSAGKQGVAASALADSRAFATKVATLDPTAADFATALDALIKSAAEENPALRVGQAPVASGTEFTGGPGETPSNTATMSIDDFRKERAKRRGRG